MNKMDFIDRLYGNMKSEFPDLSKSDVEKLVNIFFDTIKSILESEGKLKIRGFGTLEVTTRAARKVVNPKTGEEMTVPPQKTVRFRVSKTFLEKID